MPAEIAHAGPLVLSLLALAVGPLVYHLARAAGHMLAALDGFVYVAIGGLVVLHIMPESFALAGWVALVAGLAGLVLPSIVEHRLVGRARQVHNVALVLGLVAICLHGMLDGLALVYGPEGHGGGEAGHMLPMAVILHRFPVGLTIWFLLRPQYGRRTAGAVLLLIGAFTTVGFVAGETVHAAMASGGRGVFQAAVAGSLLHVIIHRSYPVSGATGTGRWLSGLGALAGLVLLATITTEHAVGPALGEAGRVFVHLARESAPALVLAYAGAGMIHAFMPRASFNWLKRGGPLGQAFRGMAFGLPLPICSCGVVPVYRALVRQGVPAAAAMAFLIATPELSLDAVLISVPLLGGEFAAVRVAAAAIVALSIGWLIGRRTRVLVPQESAGDEVAALNGSIWRRLATAMRSGFVDVVDDTAPWILVGLAIAALLYPLFRAEWLEVLPPGTEVLVFAVLGMPTYVCASGATPLVAVLILKGVSPGAALAFLLTGPATNITTFGVLSRLHGRRQALAFGAGIALLSVALGLLVNALAPDLAGPARLRQIGEGDWGLSGVALALLGGAFIWSLVRRGPRGFAGELFESGEGEDGCAHDCGDGHDHGHGHDHDHDCDQDTQGCYAEGGGAAVTSAQTQRGGCR